MSILISRLAFEGGGATEGDGGVHLSHIRLLTDTLTETTALDSHTTIRSSNCSMTR
jgi:hypothetical protein